MTDEALYEQWQLDRGSSAPPVTPAQKPQLIAALRDRWERMKNPLPLEACEICGVRARGPHRSK